MNFEESRNTLRLISKYNIGIYVTLMHLKLLHQKLNVGNHNKTVCTNNKYLLDLGGKVVLKFPRMFFLTYIKENVKAVCTILFIFYFIKKRRPLFGWIRIKWTFGFSLKNFVFLILVICALLGFRN